MTTDPRVRDFTDHSRRLPVSVVASPVFEFLLGLFLYQSRSSKEAIADDIDSSVLRTLRHPRLRRSP